MPLLSIDKNETVTLLLWELNEDIDFFKTMVPENIFSYIAENNRLEKRKLEKLSQVVLLASAGIDYSKLYYNPNGKPLLQLNEMISFSHSGDYSALLICKENCGLDLELASDKIIRISNKFINESEASLIKTEENIYWAWTIKEAVFKYFGEAVLFKDHIKIVSIQAKQNKALVHYDGFHGIGEFELKIQRIKNYYLAYTKKYTPQ